MKGSLPGRYSWLKRKLGQLGLKLVGVLSVTCPNGYKKSTMYSFLGNLPELLLAMTLDSRTLECIAELSDHRYIQFRVESRTMVAEVVTNRFLDEINAMDEKDEDQLRTLGFAEPTSSQSPNWTY